MNGEILDPRREVVAHLAALGRPYKVIARETGVNPNICYKTARQRGVPRRLPLVSPLARKQILTLLLATNLSYAHIARLVRVSKATVGRVAKDIRERQRKRVGSFQPDESKRVKRCSKHGLVNIWPCVACVAEQSKSTRTNAAN